MAYIRHEYCRICKRETQWINKECEICARRRNIKRIATWNKRSTKSKLTDLRQRIEKLEAGPPTY